MAQRTLVPAGQFGRLAFHASWVCSAVAAALAPLSCTHVAKYAQRDVLGVDYIGVEVRQGWVKLEILSSPDTFPTGDLNVREHRKSGVHTIIVPVQAGPQVHWNYEPELSTVRILGKSYLHSLDRGMALVHLRFLRSLAPGYSMIQCSNGWYAYAACPFLAMSLALALWPLWRAWRYRWLRG